MKILVTGGAGFIGSNFVGLALREGHSVVVIDALTYAGHKENLEEFSSHPDYRFVEGDIRNGKLVEEILRDHQIGWVANFAAESHVDKSITGPRAFLDTNIIGTYELLQASLGYWKSLPPDQAGAFRFLHVSTDEVFGSLGEFDPAFTEETPYQPNSPYSASKAASDHLVRAWHHTYGLPVIQTNCSNNYGPKQFVEKFIPHLIFKSLAGEKLPVYGKGLNVRDWIHVRDHCRGVLLALEKGWPGESYCFGGNQEVKNIDLAQTLCRVLDQKRPLPNGEKYSSRIEFVADRPGHDLRYAIDDRKAKKELGYERSVVDFETGLRDTIDWYLKNLAWAKSVTEQTAGKFQTKITYDWGKISK